MQKSLFEIALDHVLRFEGGFSDHPEDPGGRTQKGITQRTFNAWRRQIDRETEDVANISEEEVKQIYQVNYWQAIRGDELPKSIAVVMLDAAVNSGPKRAVEALQKALRGIGHTVTVDGQIGPNTIRAANAAPEEGLLDEFVVQRGRFYGLLQTFRTFGLGWARRLVAGARLGHKVLDQTRSVPEDGISASEHMLPDEESTSKPVELSHSSISAPTDLKRYFFESRRAQTYGSFFKLWGGWATARHVVIAMQNRPPPFASGEVLLGGDDFDVALIGCTFPEQVPPAPRTDQSLVAMGFPAGAHMPAIRRCVVYRQRPNSTAWIARITAPSEPVVVGMSGGVVFDEGTNELVGVIIHRNSPADLDNDGEADQSLDFVSLSDVHTHMRSHGPGARLA